MHAMRSRVRDALLAAAFTLVAWPLWAADGVLVVEQTTVGAFVRMSRVQIEPQRMRAEMVEPDGSTQVAIFDGTQQVLWVVSPARQTYMELTRADLDQRASQANAMMAMLEERLKNLPPAQRAQIAATMGRGGGLPGTPGEAPRTEYRSAGSGTVGPWSCQAYEGFQSDQKTSELCTVEPSALGLTTADFAVSGQMAEFFRAIMPQSSAPPFSVGSPGDQGFSGVPVRRVNLIGQQSVTEVTSITRASFPDSLFVVPDGFTKQAISLAPSGPGR
jgi:hypothetical protein